MRADSFAGYTDRYKLYYLAHGVAAEIALARELGLRIDFVAPKWEEVNDGNQQPEQGEAWRA